MKFLVTICGRGGSKGIPGKNIKKINELPLIAYSIQVAHKFAKDYDADIALSTDDLVIKQTAEQYGLKTDYIRPAELGSDTAGKIDVIKDLLHYQERLNNIKYDYVLDLDITSPLRTIDDLQNALKIIEADKHAVNIFSVNPSSRNPYFNMVEKNSNGYYTVVKQLQGNYTTRQSAPKVYDMNASFYFYKKNFFSENYKSAITDKSLVYVMPHICFDLDEIHDFEFMDFLIKNNKLNFQL